ncbi:ankyrin repeat-containing domain protein [Sphaerosporella brunnea]|uniref:Ankyrin repeat-containing domain protein n=1 Tax=Sphaerosporella brunnea TaxID=1250544 RepID=A0A5J5EF22_9PEZI|nr:ankyrin repeat-containing domain protein [Sphaerosporella brunnea]
MPSPNIWIAASDNDIAAVARFIAADPSCVNARDDNGYTPLHAAASYNHIQLLKSLVRNHGANPNITDFDGDTPLFVVETVDAARCLVEELGTDPEHKNEEGLTAADSIEQDGDFPLVAAYLREREGGVPNGATAPAPPVGVQISYSTEAIDESIPPVDAELRRRIEELASREDFGSDSAQQELRNLITGAVREHVASPENGDSFERNVRVRREEN